MEEWIDQRTSQGCNTMNQEIHSWLTRQEGLREPNFAFLHKIQRSSFYKWILHFEIFLSQGKAIWSLQKHPQHEQDKCVETENVGHDIHDFHPPIILQFSISQFLVIVQFVGPKHCEVDC